MNEKLILEDSPFKFYQLDIVTTDLVSWKVMVNILVKREQKNVLLTWIVLEIIDNNHAKLTDYMTNEDLENLYETEYNKLYWKVETELKTKKSENLDIENPDELFS